MECILGLLPCHQESADTAYDALKLLAETVERNGDTAKSVIDGLLAIRQHVGASGTISFDPHGGILREPRLYRVNGEAYEALSDSK